jgi:hypothetical protein
VTTKRLNQQVNRNLERFPPDFIFQLDIQELANLKLQFATSSLPGGSHGGARKPPRMFTEHGAIMAATVRNSPRAVQMSVYVVRAFVKLREVLASNSTLARRLDLELARAVRGRQWRPPHRLPRRHRARRRRLYVLTDPLGRPTGAFRDLLHGESAQRQAPERFELRLRGKALELQLFSLFHDYLLGWMGRKNRIAQRQLQDPRPRQL